MKIINKKAQAVLPFFALNLSSLIIFFIVIISISAMSRNLRFTMSEFDEQILPIMSQRRLLSSADCFAYEVKEITFDASGNMITGTKVFPGVLDINKLTDVEHFNCLRKDNYDIRSDIYSTSGMWDAENRYGASFRYAVTLFDPLTGNSVYRSLASEDDPNQNDVNSIVERVSKKEANCNGKWYDFSDACNVYGRDWDCIQTCDKVGIGPITVYEFNQDEGPLGHLCKKGRCELQEGGILGEGGLLQQVGTRIKPYWTSPLTSDGSNVWATTVFDTKVIAPSWNYNKGYGKNDVSWYPEGQIDEFGGTSGYSLTCGDQANTRRNIIPVMVNYRDNHDRGEIRPGIFIFESCVIEGDKYDGLTVLDDIVIESELGVCD